MLINSNLFSIISSKLHFRKMSNYLISRDRILDRPAQIVHSTKCIVWCAKHISCLFYILFIIARLRAGIDTHLLAHLHLSFKISKNYVRHRSRVQGYWVSLHRSGIGTHLLAHLHLSFKISKKII